MNRRPAAASALTHRVSVRVTGTMHREVRQTAAALRVTRSELVEFLLDTPLALNSPTDHLEAALSTWRAGKAA